MCLLRLCRLTPQIADPRSSEIPEIANFQHCCLGDLTFNYLLRARRGIATSAICGGRKEEVKIYIL